MLIKDNTINKNYLLFNRYFNEGETCCIVAKPGVGKTFLACNIAKQVLKAAYFELDDGYCQKKRLEQVKSIHPIYLPEFEDAIERLRKNARYKCLMRAYTDGIFELPSKIEKRNSKLQKKFSLEEKIEIDGLLVFEIFVKEAIQNGYELIILDTLSALTDSPCEITRKCVKRVSLLCRKKRVSFLILQHTTKEGIYHGTSGLAQVVDTLLYLEDLGGNLRLIKVEKARFEKIKDDCIVEMVSEGDSAVSFRVCENPKIILKQNLSPLEKNILDVIADNESIDFELLINALNISNETSVKNTLKSLENKGFITKGDGKSWKVIFNRHFKTED